MSRFLTAFALAFGCATFVVQAQDTTTRTTTTVKSEGGDVKTVTYTGCVQTGTEARTYVLDKVVPVRQTTTTDLSTGQSSTVTSYMLVPGERVTVQEHVGHKVEVTGTLIPAGETKTVTKTEVDREDAKDSKSRETVKTKNDMPQFRVTSIKTVADTCN